MGPKLGVVVKALDLIDLILCFDVTMLGYTNVDPDPRMIHILPIQSTAFDGLVGGPNANRPGSRSATYIFLGLVFCRRKITNTRQSLSHIADLVRLNAAAAIQQTFAVGFQVIAIGACQTDCSHHNPLLVRQLPSFIVGDHGPL